MDAEFESKLKEIGSLLGITELPDNIGDIVDSFISDTGDRNAEADGETACGGECEKSTGGLFSSSLYKATMKPTTFPESIRK